MENAVPVPLLRGRHVRHTPAPRAPKPDWLKVRGPGSEGYVHLKRLMRTLDLHTVCEEANCPNIGECWHHGTATFMILGNVFTRSCGFCNVVHGRPDALDREEPARVANAVAAMGIQYVVITSVDRDDLEDFGAWSFAETVRRTRALRPDCRIEILIPDFQGDETSLRTVLDARPDVLNHNTETVPRLFPTARPGGRYARSLQLLDRARHMAPDTPTKSGIMVGLGEQWHEIVEVLRDLREVGCSILTVGQYLRPSQANLPLVRYYHPDEFDALKRLALDLGFVHAECGPLVRSSYHAHEQIESYDRTMKGRRLEPPF